MNIKYEKQKLRWVSYLFAFLENTCFVFNSMGNEPAEGSHLYFEALKGLLRKNTLHFFWFLQEMTCYYPGT